MAAEGAIALVLVLAAFAPSVVRRLRGLSQAQLLSASDVGFSSLVAVVACALAFFGVFLGIWWLTVLGIMLAPLSFIFRSPRVCEVSATRRPGPRLGGSQNVHRNEAAKPFSRWEGDFYAAILGW